MTDKKCPKCGSRNFQIADHYSVAYLYEVQDGVVEADGMDNDFGRHIETTCTCHNCKHQWHPRNLEYTIDK